jgi:hypothetical protein
MTKEQISNAIILAEFVGLEKLDNHRYKNVNTNITYSVDDLKFHEDWNLLMLVDEKINSLMTYVVKIISTPTASSRWLSHSVIITVNTVHAILKNEHLIKYSSDYSINESKISTVYNAYVQLVKYINDK